MRLFSTLIALATAATSIALTGAGAQTLGATFMQGSFGAGSSTGGRYVERDEYIVDGLLGRRLTAPGTALISAIAAAGRFVNGSDLTCQIEPPQTTCLPMMPRFNQLSVLVGAEVGGRAGSAALMLGPALAHRGSWYGGAQIRADLVSPRVARLALVVSPQLLLVPNVDRVTLSVWNVTLGVRLR